MGEKIFFTLLYNMGSVIKPIVNGSDLINAGCFNKLVNEKAPNALRYRLDRKLNTI